MSATDEDVIAICNMVAEGKTIRQLCEKFGVSPGTIMNWVTATKERVEHYARAREAAADMFESEIIEAAMTTSSENAAADRVKIDALKWVAARRAPKRYGEKITAEHTGPNGGPVLTRDVSDMTDDELAAFLP